MMNDIGYLYVICDGSKVKIGKSKTPEKRTRNLISISGIITPRVFISSECSASSNKENICHKYYSQSKVCGEWFSVSFNEAVDTVKRVTGSECLLEKKIEDKKYHKLQSAKRKYFTDTMLNSKVTSDGFNSLFQDTSELISICEDDSLIDRLAMVNGCEKRLLIVRCEALFDVINQQSTLLNLGFEQ
jgi:hypothetical protein